MNSKTTPLVSCTVEQFIEALKEGLGLSSIPTDDIKVPEVKKHYVYGLAGLEKLLGVCHSTAQSIKNSGVIDAATSQHGRVLVFDADLVIDLLKVNKRIGNYKYKRE